MIVIDYGSQYNQLIVRRIRELSVYAELISPDDLRTTLILMKSSDLFLSGGPNSAL